jgi:AsmA protein
MRLIKAFVAMLLGVIVLVVAAMLLMPADRIAQIAAQQFQANTGRSLHIGGEVRPSFYPVIGATAFDVEIGNPDWAGEGPMLSAEGMDIGLDMTALFRGDILIERIVLQAPRVHLIRDAQGRANWDFTQQARPVTDVTEAPTGQAEARQISLAAARIANGSLRFDDAQSNTAFVLEGLNASLAMPALEGPADLTAAGVLNGQPFEISAQTEDAARLLSGAVAPVTLEGSAAGGRLSFAGRFGLGNLEFDGQLAAELPALRPVLQLAGQTGDELARSYLPLGLSGRITRTADGGIYTREAQFRAGAVRLSGGLDLLPGGERPRLTGQLAGDVLDLRSASTGQSSAAQTQAANAGWSRAPIDASALGLVDAEISLSLNGLQTDFTTFGRTRLGLSLDRARAVVAFREVALFGGQMTGEFVANNRAGLSVGGNLRLREINLLPLLTELADYRRIQGPADLDVQFLGVGNTLHAIMNSLRGEGRLALGAGELLGFDLAGMLRNLDMSYMGEGRRTVYQSVTGSFTMAEGVLRNEDLRLEATSFSVTGRGQVGLGARNLDYRIVPAALRNEDSLRVPLMITGPWDAPRFRLDMEALAREQLQAEQERLEELARQEAQRLEERARSEAVQRIERELGVEAQQGESVQDTIRRGVEEELGRRLRGLMGGN